MKIADRLKGRSVAEWMEVITATEFQAWKDFFIKEVESERREDYHAASIAYEVYRLPYQFGFIDPKKHPMLSMDQFLVKFTTQPPEKKEEPLPTADEQKAGFAAFIEAAKSSKPIPNAPQQRRQR